MLRKSGKSRSLKFASDPHNRYWWHKSPNANYVPPIYSFLNDREWEILEEWFNDTGEKFESTGEAGVPPLNFLLGLIMGNGLSRIVQCGHYVGYSTLLIGFMLKKMNSNGTLYSVDIDPNVTAYTQAWVDKAALADYVHLETADSADSLGPTTARQRFGGNDPQLVFIDSSHQYEHTLKELALWYPALCKGGFMCLHDTSKFASLFDSSGKGGVFRAVTEWSTTEGIPSLSLNSWVTGGQPGDFPYMDGCGLTIFQKNQ